MTDLRRRIAAFREDVGPFVWERWLVAGGVAALVLVMVVAQALR